MNYGTRALTNLAADCKDTKSFEEILNMLQADRPAWQEYLKKIIANNNYTKDKFARLCGVSRTAVSKWCNGAIPSSRDDFIRIGFAAHYSLGEMNWFLKRYGKYPALSPKSLEDSVYMFVLKSEEYPHTYAFCRKTIDDISERMGKDTSSAQECETAVLTDNLLSLTSLDQLEKFITENAAIYKTVYDKFYDQVIEILTSCAGTSSISGWMTKQCWTSSMTQCISAIRQRKWMPLRRKVIALGIYLCLPVYEIDQLLQAARMEPLCGKSPIESAIIFAITDAERKGVLRPLSSVRLQRDQPERARVICEHVQEVLCKFGIQDADLLLNDLDLS